MIGGSLNDDAGSSAGRIALFLGSSLEAHQMLMSLLLTIHFMVQQKEGRLDILWILLTSMVMDNRFPTRFSRTCRSRIDQVLSMY